MLSRPIKPSVLYFGTPVALLSSVNGDGSSNLTPISSVWALGDRLVMGLGLDGQAWRNLQCCTDCVINLPDASLWPQVERMARATGRHEVPAGKQAMGYVHVADKFALAGLGAEPGLTVQAQRVRDCPLQIEARLLPPGADELARMQDRGFAILEAQVLQVHAHERICIPGGPHIDTTAWQPLLYVFRHYCGTSAPRGANFRAETAFTSQESA